MNRAGDQLRLDVLSMGFAAGSGHMGGSMSCAEIMSVLYDRILRIDPQNPQDRLRDRFILSKGHAAPMLYACLARKGYIERSELASLRNIDSPLQGHPSMLKMPGIDMSTGSLGLGLSVGVGMALSLRGTDSRVYVLLGDGEMQEGQNWEALMSVCSFNLANITPIVDLNGVQLDGRTNEIQPNQTELTTKLKGFGFVVKEIDGHDEEMIESALIWAQQVNKPHIIVANTVKGKGISFMEGQSAWHGKPLSEADYRLACEEIEGRLHQ